MGTKWSAISTVTDPSSGKLCIIDSGGASKTITTENFQADTLATPTVTGDLTMSTGGITVPTTKGITFTDGGDTITYYNESTYANPIKNDVTFGGDGQYTRVGGLIHFTVTASSYTGNTGDIYIRLPFDPKTAGTVGIGYSTTQGFIYGIIANTNRLYLYKYDGTQLTGAISLGDVSFSVTYNV